MDDLQKWFLEHADDSAADKSFQKLADEFGTDDYSMAEEGYTRFSQAVGEENRRSRPRRILRVAEHVAAALLLPLCILGAVLLTRKPAAVEWAEAYTHTGETKTVTLPDGSTLRLAPDTRLVYPSDFRDGTRKVFLKGEAYADITHLEDCPFEIHSGDITVTVLGTEFNFSSYPGDAESELALVDGSVEMAIAGKDGGHTLRMKTGDLVRYDHQSGSVERQRFSSGNYTDYILRGGLQFTNRRMDDIVRCLERKFGVRIVIEDERIAGERFYASFINGEDLTAILQALNTQNYMKIKWKGDSISLSLK